MKLCYLADAQSIHTQRWCRSIALLGHEVVLLSFKPAEINGVKVRTLWRPFHTNISRTASFLSRTLYLFGIFQVRRIVKLENPDILHGFYATSYGLLTAISGHKPYHISVWGSDVNVSPNNWIFRKLLRYTLNRASLVFCTSQSLIAKSAEFINDQAKLKHIPFGIDIKQFVIGDATDQNSQDTIIIGSTKSLERVYGINILIEAFAKCYQQHSNIRLHLIGRGSEEGVLVTLARERGIDQVTHFIKVDSHADIPEQLAKMQIFVIPSYQESFGVAALEASAMGLPVIGSAVGGIPEVVVDNKTGLLVQSGDIEALRDALLSLINNPQLRTGMGRKGRQFVEKNYIWSENVDNLHKEYELNLQSQLP